jgi:hypothetical protein
MDAFVLDAAATAGGMAILFALAYRKPRQRSPGAPPRIATMVRAMRNLRRRHRRAARAIIELAQECLERHPDNSFEAFTAREALQSYLPETLAAYLAVPKALRRVQRAGGPSPDDMLGRQLAMLYAGLERIREADAEAGSARMAVNGAFLDERFASPNRPAAPSRRSVLSEFVDGIEIALRKA